MHSIVIFVDIIYFENIIRTEEGLKQNENL